MANSTARRRSARPERFVVSVTAPDGGAASTRGLGPWLTTAAPTGARGDVTVALISDGRMKALNRTFLGKHSATDVLSFPAARDSERGDGHAAPAASGSAARPYLGDIVIASGVAQRQAKDAGHSLATELRVLALHGLLHLLGYDHEKDGGEMAREEERLRRKGGLGRGVIDRTATSPRTPARHARR